MNGAIIGFCYGLRIVEGEAIKIEQLTLTGNSGDAMVVIDSRDVNIEDARVFVPAGPPSTDIHIQKNQLYYNEDGIFLVGVQDSRIVNNHAYLNRSVGIALIEGSVGNKILHNTASGNGAWDMGHTPDSTPNQWLGNTCSTSEGIDVDCP